MDIRREVSREEKRTISSGDHATGPYYLLG
jgi:hypothetical protein